MVLFVSVLLTADLHIACRAHVVPLPCHAAKGLECVFPIWFTRCSRVWFTLAMPRPCHPRPCLGLENNGMVRAWHGLGMASVNQKRPHYVNQMGKTHSKPLEARHGRERHAMCESDFSMISVLDERRKEYQNIYLCSIIFSENRSFYEIMPKYILELYRPQMTKRRVRIACCVTKIQVHTLNM